MSQGVKKGFVIALIGQGIAGVFLLLFQIFAGRWLGVESYGFLNVLYSTVTIVTVFVISGVVQALIRFIAHHQARKDSTGLRQTIQTNFLAYLLLFSVFLVIVLIFRRYFMNNLFNGSAVVYEQFIFGVFGFTLFRFLCGISQGYREFQIQSIGKGMQGFFMFSIMALIVKIFGGSVIEVGWCIALSLVLSSIYMWLVMRDDVPGIKWKEEDEIDMRTLKFIMVGGSVTIMNQWVLRSGPILLKMIAGGEADYLAGLYSAIIMPMSYVRTVVFALLVGLYPNLTRAYSIGDKNLIRRYVYKSIGIVAGLAVMIVPVYYFFGPRIVQLLYREEFVASRVDTTLISLVISFYLVGLLLSKILMARGTPKYSAISFICGIAVMLILIFVLDMSPLRRVELSLLGCTFFYTMMQLIYLLTGKIKRKKINSK